MAHELQDKRLKPSERLAEAVTPGLKYFFDDIINPEMGWRVALREHYGEKDTSDRTGGAFGYGEEPSRGGAGGGFLGTGNIFDFLQAGNRTGGAFGYGEEPSRGGITGLVPQVSLPSTTATAFGPGQFQRSTGATTTPTLPWEPPELPGGGLKLGEISSQILAGLKAQLVGQIERFKTAPVGGETEADKKARLVHLDSLRKQLGEVTQVLTAQGISVDVADEIAIAAPGLAQLQQQFEQTFGQDAAEFERTFTQDAAEFARTAGQTDREFFRGVTESDRDFDQRLIENKQSASEFAQKFGLSTRAQDALEIELARRFQLDERKFLSSQETDAATIQRRASERTNRASLLNLQFPGLNISPEVIQGGISEDIFGLLAQLAEGRAERASRPPLLSSTFFG